jgi:predicted transposase YdaD
MFIYHYRIYDLHRHTVISLAILADDNIEWRSQSFGYEYGGFAINMEFPTIKLLDYRAKWSELEASSNPFAVVVMAHLKAMETRRYPKSRLRSKIEIVKSLYARGWSRANVWELFRFLDWVMELPERFELQFEKALQELEEGENMRYVTHIERRAKAEGVKEGIEKGSVKAIRESILEVLALRFQSIPDELVAQINKLTELDRLKALLRQAAIVGSLEEFEHFVETSVPR